MLFAIKETVRAMKERFEKQMNFLLELDKVKEIYRQNYISDKSRKENDAEHSWHSCVMAFVLAEYFDKDVDLLKVIKMMLMHDVVEIYAGDTYCYDEAGYADKAEREMESAKRVYGLLPEDQRNEFMSLWREFEEGGTKEADFCAILDRIQPTMLNYATDGISWLEHGIKKEQVIKRNKTLLEAGEPISGYVRGIIENAAERGLLK